MRHFVLFACALVATATRLRDTPKVEKTQANATDKSVAEVASRMNKLEHVVGGMETIYASQSKAATGPTKFAQILKPFLSEMHQVLGEVKNSTKLTSAQKLEKLHHAEESVEGLKKDMSSLTSDLKAQGVEDKESILMGVLMSRKNRPESEQMEVLKSDDFKDLECVKYVLAHRDAKKNLVEQVATYIDSKSPPKPAGAAPKISLQDMTQEIVESLEGQLKKLEKHLADQEKFHKKVDTELNDKVKDEQKKMGNLKGSDKSLKNRTTTDQKAKTAHAIKLIHRMQKKEDREYIKQHALMAHDVGSLKKAIESVKKGDMKALREAQQALMKSMEAMKAKDDFLHFLQVSAWTEAKTGDCPYCKAQCLEKCHAGGNTFMVCMTQCENAGN